jgi:glycogen synthase
VLIISNLYPPHVLGGYEILCGQVCRELEQRGHRIHVLTSDHGSAESEPEITRRLRLYLPFGRPAEFLRRQRVRTARYNQKVTAEVIESCSPDIIFIWSLLRLTPAPARAAESAKVPVLYTFNDENIAGYRPAPFSLRPRALARWFLDLAATPRITLRGLRLDSTTSISRLLKENLCSAGVPVEQSRVIYQGIPLSQFPPKAEPGSMGTPVKVLYTGQMHAYKGVHTLFEALELLKRESPVPFTVTAAGTGEEEYIERLKRSAEEAGLEAVFPGRVAHHAMSSLYRDHDIFVFPSIWQEPFGLTHLEAMASGLPVVSTANGGQGEFLRNRENALTFAPGDSAQLASALKELMGNHGFAVMLAKEGMRTARTQFSFTRYVDELEALLQETASLGRRG